MKLNRLDETKKLFPHFYDRNPQSNFSKHLSIVNRQQYDIYHKLKTVDWGRILEKPIQIWKEQSEPYNYIMNFKVNMNYLKEVTIYKNPKIDKDGEVVSYDAIIDTKSYANDDISYYQYIHEDTSNVLIPRDTYILEVYTWDDYHFLKGFPENDYTYYNELDYKFNESYLKIEYEEISYSKYLTFRVHMDKIKQIQIFKNNEEVYVEDFLIEGFDNTNLHSNDFSYKYFDYDAFPNIDTIYEIEDAGRNSGIIYRANIEKDEYVFRLPLTDEDLDENGLVKDNYDLWVTVWDKRNKCGKTDIIDYTKLYEKYIDPTCEDELPDIKFQVVNFLPTPSDLTLNTIFIIKENGKYNAYETHYDKDTKVYSFKLGLANIDFTVKVNPSPNKTYKKRYSGYDDILGDCFDHDYSLDKLGRLYNVYRYKFYPVPHKNEYYYQRTYPSYNNRLTEDDYHYMKRIQYYIRNYNQIHFPILEFWKYYYTDSKLVNRKDYIGEQDRSYLRTNYDSTCLNLENIQRVFVANFNYVTDVQSYVTALAKVENKHREILRIIDGLSDDYQLKNKVATQIYNIKKGLPEELIDEVFDDDDATITEYGESQASSENGSNTIISNLVHYTINKATIISGDSNHIVIVKDTKTIANNIRALLNEYFEGVDDIEEYVTRLVNADNFLAVIVRILAELTDDRVLRQELTYKIHEIKAGYEWDESLIINKVYVVPKTNYRLRYGIKDNNQPVTIRLDCFNKDGQTIKSLQIGGESDEGLDDTYYPQTAGYEYVDKLLNIPEGTVSVIVMLESNDSFKFTDVTFQRQTVSGFDNRYMKTKTNWNSCVYDLYVDYDDIPVNLRLDETTKFNLLFKRSLPLSKIGYFNLNITEGNSNSISLGTSSTIEILNYFGTLAEQEIDEEHPFDNIIENYIKPNTKYKVSFNCRAIYDENEDTQSIEPTPEHLVSSEFTFYNRNFEEISTFSFEEKVDSQTEAKLYYTITTPEDCENGQLYITSESPTTLWDIRFREIMEE